MFSCNKKEDFQEQVANDCIGEYTSEEIENIEPQIWTNIQVNPFIYNG